MTTEQKMEAFLKTRIDHHRTELVNNCRTLADHMNAIANRLEADDVNYMYDCMRINSLGEVQTKGSIIDARFAELMTTVDALRVLKNIERES